MIATHRDPRVFDRQRHQDPADDVNGNQNPTEQKGQLGAPKFGFIDHHLEKP